MALAEERRPEMKKEDIIEIFNNNKELFIELKSQILKNPKATQISRLAPPGVNRINYNNVGQGLIDFKRVEKQFGIEESWLREMFRKMDRIGCEFLQKTYVYEDTAPSQYQGKRFDVLEFIIEPGGIFGPDADKGIAFYTHSYIPETKEKGFQGEFIFYNYFDRIEGNWYVFSRR